MMRALLIALVLTTAGAHAGEPPASRPTTRPAELVVATYNINWGMGTPAQLREIAEAIEKTDADIIAIQEGNPAVFKHLRQHLGKTYPHMQFYPGGRATGLGWMSRRPLTNKRIIARKFGMFDSAVAEVTVGGQVLTLANVHLQPFRDPGGQTTLTQMLRVFFETETVRQKEIDLVLSKLPADGPTVLLGDLNSLSVMAVPATLRDRGFADSYAAVHQDPDDDKDHTWHSTTQERAWRYRIDYVWHTRQLKTVKSQVLTAGPSDHYPVVSELEVVPVGSTTGPGGE